MILNDAYAGHRKWWRADWVEDPALAPVWTEWDYILLRVYQYIEDYTTSNGHLVWVEEDPDVAWKFDRVTSYYNRNLHEYQENNDIKDWEVLRATPEWAEDSEPPSMDKWIRRLEEDDSEGFPVLPEGGRPRPPTAAELAALDAARAEE